MPHARIKKWTPTNRVEMKKILVITMWMGLVPIGNIADYWSKRLIYKFEYPCSQMSRNRYQLLLSTLHFQNNDEIHAENRLGKIQKLVDMLQSKFQEN